MLNRLKIGLQPKVLIVVLGTALLTSGLFALAINAVLKSEFDTYLDTSITQRNQRIVEVIEELYAQYEDWEWVSSTLDSIAPTINSVVRVTDLNGRVVLDSSTGDTHDWMMRRGMMGQGMMRGRGGDYYRQYYWDYQGEARNVYTYPVEYKGKQIGTAEVLVLGVSGRLSQEDLKFKETIHDTVVFASVTAGFLALLLSLVFARRITSPIMGITEAAGRVSSGDFKARAPVETNDELGALAITFNRMADRFEEIDEMRKKFTADVAHELRTPVTTIRSYIEGFQDGVLKPTPERLKELEEETLRLAELISDLQNLTVIESHSSVLEEESFDLAQEVRGLAGRVSPLFREKGVGLRVEAEGEIEVLADRRLLGRAIGNLVNNALKYTERGGEVTVDLYATSNEISIKILDSGIGIPEADLPYIFDRFYRADPSRARSTGGSGIGLSLVKEIVEAHGGKVTVESSLGQGSIFTIHLPRR